MAANKPARVTLAETIETQTTRSQNKKQQERQSKGNAKVALLDFCKKKRGKAMILWRKARWQLALPWQAIGKVQEYMVEYVELPWQEQDFAALTLEQQRQVFLRFLQEAKKRGAVVAGIPMNWRLVLGNKAPVFVPDGKDLAIQQIAAKLDTILDGMTGKQVAVIGIEEKWHQKMVEEILRFGGKPVLTGSRGKSLANFYFKKKGIAIPVLRASKSLRVSDGAVFLGSNLPGKITENSLVFREVNVAVEGDWRGNFVEGRFPCGLAAALLEVGAVLAPDKKSPTIVWSDKNLAG